MRRARRAQGLGYCVREGPRRGSEGLHQEIREFATTTRGLLLLRDWLASFEVRLVGMEATGVYWKPVYYLLEDDDFELVVASQCSAPQERPRQEDRRQRRRVDLPAC